MKPCPFSCLLEKYQNSQSQQELESHCPSSVQTRPPTPSACLDNNSTAYCPLCFFAKTCCLEKNYNIYNKYDNGNPKTLSCGSNSLSSLSVSYLQVLIQACIYVITATLGFLVFLYVMRPPHAIVKDSPLGRTLPCVLATMKPLRCNLRWIFRYLELSMM
jgi:hypothetical protein